MLFPTHLLAGYALGRLTDRPVAWLVVGAALPDVVDKPLATVGVVDLFHSLGHSAFALAGLAVVAALAGRPEPEALAVGVGSHLLLDAGHVVLNGRAIDALFLGWPAVVPPDPLALPPVAFARFYIGTPSFFLECLFWVGFVTVALSPRLRARLQLS